jgi:hypothetical protein
MGQLNGLSIKAAQPRDKEYLLADGEGLYQYAVDVGTVNPGFILGPSLVPWGRFSLETFRGMALGKSPLMVDMDEHQEPRPSPIRQPSRRLRFRAASATIVSRRARR